MRLNKLSIYTLLAVFAALAVLTTAPLHAKKGPDLPPLPSPAILEQVINQTDGPTFTPLGVPAGVNASLVAFGKKFDGVENLVSTDEAITYLGTNGLLLETVLPLVDSGSQVLAPDMTAPGLNPLPGKIVGALYQPGRGTMVMVAVFENSTSKPKQVRLYYKNKKYYELKVKAKDFKSPTANSYDEGAIISQKESCVTVGMSQLCWKPDNKSDVREQEVPAQRVTEAYNRANKAYKFKSKFLLKDAVPDLIGNGVRANCATAFNTTPVGLDGTLPPMAACDPNLYMTATKEVKHPTDPIALWVVDQQADLKAFTHTGTYLGYVPAGEYLVVNATPEVTTPGEIGVLMLVNINDKNNHYLIPSIRMQQYGDGSKEKKRVASIKDGCTWYYGW